MVVNSAPAVPRRIREFVRWVLRTPWPVFSLGLLQADIIGALLVLGFLRFGLPPADRIKLQDLPGINLAVFIGYLLVSFLVGASISFSLLRPVFRWQRRDLLILDNIRCGHGRLNVIKPRRIAAALGDPYQL